MSINKCKDKAKLLADASRGVLGEVRVKEFYDAFQNIKDEYEEQHPFSSHSIKLEFLPKFKDWLPSVEHNHLFLSLVVEGMLNHDLYSLSLYQNLDIYAGVSDSTSMGDNELAETLGCKWVTAQEDAL